MSITKLLLTVLTIAATSASAHAASITCETFVKPLNQWVRLVPELRGQLNGRVVNNPRLGGLVTDSVGLGERLRWRVLPTVKSEKSVQFYCALDFQVPSAEAKLAKIPTRPIPASDEAVSPNFFVPVPTQMVFVARTEAGRFTLGFPFAARQR